VQGLKENPESEIKLCENNFSHFSHFHSHECRSSEWNVASFLAAVLQAVVRE